MPRLCRKASVPLLLVCLTLLLAAGAGGCGGAGSSPVVVRVGRVGVDRATVDHWTKAIQLGTVVEGELGRSSATPRQKALEFLISSNWAIGAAAERGHSVSDGAVARGLKEKIDAAPNGGAEFKEEVLATGQTLADVRFEIKAALALTALREIVSKKIPPVTPGQIADYYRSHPQSFRIPDRRSVDLIESIHGHARAVALAKELGSGKRFAERAQRELVARETPYEAAHSVNAAMVRAIFATPPGRVGAALFHGLVVLLVVRKLVPSSIKPLGREVKEEIAEHLYEERHGRALANFLEPYRREWTAKTSCAAGFLVQKCAGYRGRLAPEGDLLAADFNALRPRL